MKTVVCLFAALLLSISLASAQNTRLAWDAVTTLLNGEAIPAGETIRYKVYAGPEMDTLTERAETDEVSIPFADLSLASEDKYVAVEAFNDQRLGSMSAVKAFNTFNMDIVLRSVIVIQE